MKLATEDHFFEGKPVLPIKNNNIENVKNDCKNGFGDKFTFFIFYVKIFPC